MYQMSFIDRVILKLKAGRGGNGIVSFRREKYVAFGGPDGGDGGDGGDIVFVGDGHKSTLLDLRFQRQITADHGENGKSKKMHGARGKNRVLKVPLGTVVTDEDGNLLADVMEAGQEFVICRGGQGGKGNYRFKSSKNHTPDYCQLGALGEAKTVVVELKLLADVGIVGFPSVGKSTFISVVSAVRPKIADFPFTTLVPNLGVVPVNETESFVLADMPGLIEGAADGKGLGHRFLQHIERTKVLIHMIDMSGKERSPIEDYQVINEELVKYNPTLLERPQIIVASKMDEAESVVNLQAFREQFPQLVVYPVCALIQEGVQEVIYAAHQALQSARDLFHEANVLTNSRVVYKFQEATDFAVHNLGNGQWEITGDKITRLFYTTPLTTELEVIRFGLRLQKMGIDKLLKEHGVQDGDLVTICNYQFVFEDK